jgi:hypothetical protein
VYGVKLRIKDRQCILALLEYMFPGIEDAHSFDRGSRSELAPTLDALMHAVIGLIGPINDLVDLFAPLLDDAEELRFEDSWVETFENLGVMIKEVRMVPMQSSNDGTSVAPAAPQQQIPGWPAAAPAPHPQQPPLAPPYYQAPPPPAPPVDTGHGVSMDSVLANNPALAARVFQQAPMGMQMGGYPQAAQQRVPSWAQPSPYGGAPMPASQPSWVQNRGYQQPQPGYPQQQPGYPQPGYPQPGYPGRGF